MWCSSYHIPILLFIDGTLNSVTGLNQDQVTAGA